MADSKVKLKTQQITNFTSGEFSPQMAGRVDLEAFASSARKISNFLPEVTGGLKKFYGTRHVAEVDTARQQVLVPFINKYEPMALLIRDGATGLVRSGEYEELSVKIPGGLDISKLRWKQVNDRILFAHPDVQPFSIDFQGIDDSGKYLFTTDFIEFDEVPYFPIGWKGDYSGSLVFESVSGATNTYTATIESGVSVLLSYPEPIADSSFGSRASSEFGPTQTGEVSPAYFELIKVTSSGESVVASGAAGTAERSVSYIKIASTYKPYRVTFFQKVDRELILKTVKTVFPESKTTNGKLEIKDPGAKQISPGDTFYIKLVFPEIVINDVTDKEELINTSERASASGIVFNNTNLIGRKIKIYANSNSVAKPWVANEEIESNAIRYSNGNFYRANMIILTSGKKICGDKQPTHKSGTVSDGKAYWTYFGIT